jgi:hypothetical protein
MAADVKSLIKKPNKALELLKKVSYDVTA